MFQVSTLKIKTSFLCVFFYRDPTESPLTPTRDAIVHIMERRRKWMHRPIHSIAALLHPTYKAPHLHSNAELSTDRTPIWRQSCKMPIKGSFLWRVDQVSWSKRALQTLYALVESQWWSHSFGESHLVIKCLTSKEVARLVSNNRI